MAHMSWPIRTSPELTTRLSSLHFHNSSLLLPPESPNSLERSTSPRTSFYTPQLHRLQRRITSSALETRFSEAGSRERQQGQGNPKEVGAELAYLGTAFGVFPTLLLMSVSSFKSPWWDLALNRNFQGQAMSVTLYPCFHSKMTSVGLRKGREAVRRA